MTQPEQYDDLVVGSGEAGKYLAWHLARWLPYTTRHDAILTHQTMAEGLSALFAAVPRSRAGRQWVPRSERRRR